MREDYQKKTGRWEERIKRSGSTNNIEMFPKLDEDIATSEPSTTLGLRRAM